MSCSRRSSARRRYWGEAGGAWTLNPRIEEGQLMPDHGDQEMANKQVDQATEARVLMKSHLSSQNPL